MTFVRSFLVVAGTLLLAISCSRAGEDSDVHADAAPSPIEVADENIVRVRRGELVVGPLISGEIRAAREATVRAEVSGVLLELNAEEGQSVRRGEVLGRIESQALEDVRNSARSAVRSAEAALNLARVEVRRNQELVAAGAIARRDLDQARAGLASAEAQVATARSNLVEAEERVGDTRLAAPISGIVSRRSAHAGDVVSIGTELFTIIAPSSMRLEASVPSEEIGMVKVGNPVQFTLRGYDRTFAGRVERVSPEADEVTRQVPVYITLPNIGGRLISGIFGEGRVITKSAAGLVVPANAVNMEDDQPWVLRVTNGTAERVDVVIGLRDETTERVLITFGVSEGDLLLRGAEQAITPGTPVKVSR